MAQAYAIMLHHFYDEKHPAGQGAISAQELHAIISHIGRERIIPANEWLLRAKNNDLQNYICLSFDDGLRCQYDIALPVLQAYDLTAFWFVYSSVFFGECERLEIYRYFRTIYFTDINEFYQQFKQQILNTNYAEEVTQQLQHFVAKNYLPDAPFYTNNDKEFRFLRDQVLGFNRYCQVMDDMMAQYDVDEEKMAQQLWLSKQQLQQLHQQGHIIGLHSYSHPTQMAKLSMAKQRQQYSSNIEQLTALLNYRPTTMSHPCNSYSATTLAILKDLDIELGFCANLQATQNSVYEYPREDHANLMRQINENKRLYQQST